VTHQIKIKKGGFMRVFMYLLVFFVVITFFYGISFANEEWELVHGIKELDIKEIAIGEDIIYAAGSKAVYRSEDNGRTWKAVFFVESGINFIAISEKGIFACTKKGLFRSLDGELNWKEIFTGIGKEENNTLHVAFSEHGSIYLGTEKGLFISRDSGLTWEKDSKEAGNLSVKWVSFLEEDIFLVAEKGVYMSSKGGWKRVFIIPIEEIEYDVEEEDSAYKAIKPVNSMLVNEGKIFLAADFGIFMSGDKGNSWNRFESNGLISLKVSRLLFKDTLYAATDRGIFVFSSVDKTWNALYKGMDTDETNSISVDEAAAIWAATNKGLYRLKSSNILRAKPAKGGRSREDDILKEFSHEPSIRDVQRAGIEYAEVNPNKIKEWRKAAKQKALLPDVSIGVDRYVTDYYHWDAGQNPDVLIKGDDVVSWDVTASWDLGDLIWNPYQKDIDVRSRLMVQLRDDVLDEITRTYFERRRLQIETHLSPPSGVEEEVEKELRIQELTADMDGLTGGYFSAQLEK